MSATFPRDRSGLTAGWLSSVLGRDVTLAGARRIGADRGNLGEIIRLDFADGSGPLVAKFGSTRPDDLAAARRSGLYQREVRFYELLAPDLDVRVPACHAAFYDADTGHCLLLLECLESTGDLDTIGGIGPDRTAKVFAELGALHAAGRLHLELPWLQGMRFEGRINNLQLMISKGWPRLVELCPDLIEPSFGDGLGRRLAAMMHRLDDLDQTIVHGDLKPDNLQATRDGIAILDWQSVGYGPPAWDVAYAMVNCLTTDDRREHERHLLDQYPHDLSGYTDALLFPLIVATALTVMGDPNEPRRIELIRTTAARAWAALQDHGVLGPRP